MLDDEAEPGGYDVTASITAPGQLALARQADGDGYVLQIGPAALQLEVTRGGKTAILARVTSADLKFPYALTAQRRGPRWDFIAGGAQGFAGRK